MNRKIIHIDMDAFYASVEIRDNPELSGKPVIIGALPGTRGVVSTCNYEARKYGVHSAMSVSEAYRLCPKGIFLNTHMSKYVRESEKIHKIMESYTDMIEYVSLDEGYMDVTASEKFFGSAEEIGKELKRRVFEETGLTCSVGIGYSMTSAKTASEEKKPDGFFVIPTREAFVELIKDRPIRALYGVGEKTAKQLANKGYEVVSDLYGLSPSALDFLGKTGKEIYLHAQGYCNREVTPNEEQKSVGREYTFQSDLTKREEIEEIIHFISRQVSNILKNKEIKGKTVTIKIKYSNMKSITRSRTISYTDSARTIYETGVKLLGFVELNHPVRLVGVTVSNMEGEQGEKQLSFEDFVSEDTEINDKIDDVIFDINKTMGRGSIKTGKEMLFEKNFRNKN